ncbi:LOW QUALITY PROTEIN: uncharacterized protein LOC114941521 [Nylanderia fulva]|uniref:LOW QUALITY PROTEIN: uncharacterized protein LOC114941521 n=1 Tax=Nylanderia fulva TaxID=613905 RepID=UPI0010FAE501|nr:LOW QUALITY PROTEIN: uncharacterized protein LOC114941521 [Nylanderia fulva]
MANGSALSFDISSGSWFKDISRGSRAVIYKSKPDCSKVHSLDSPSASKEVGRDASSTMQALIPVFAILGVATSAQLTLLPYAYLADPLPVYHQSQDTRAGVHAYSYAGGPSAKEEVRGLDGVTRGSYSYVDANGLLQSVFYVADEGGFRVAATNLPTDGVQEHVEVEEAKRTTSSRRKRSLEAASPIADQDQAQNPKSSQEDQDSAESSHELPAAQEKKTDTNRSDRSIIVAPVYGLSDSILIPRLTGTATSSQSRVDIHNNVRLKAVQPVETIGVLPAPAAYETVILPSQVPLATSHQSRVQVHNNLRVETPEKLIVKDAAILPEASPVTPVQLAYKTVILPSQVPLATSHQSRVQVHNNLRVETPEKLIVKDAAILPEASPVTPVQLAAYKTVILPNQVPLATSHQSRVQVHNNLRVETPEKLIVKDAAILPEVSPVVPVQLGPLPVLPALPGYYENRIQLHKNIGIEGPNPKNAVKLDAVPLAIVETPIKTPVPVVTKQAVLPVVPKQAVLPVVPKQAVLPVVTKQAVLPVVTEQAALPVVTKQVVLPVVTEQAALPVVTKQAILPIVTEQAALPVATAVSNQSRTQIHRNAKLEVAVPIVSEPTVYTVPYSQPIPTAWQVLAAPLAQSSQFRSQIHLNEKLELTK